jgi:predicted DNA-binding transcriptional regulator YafY
MQEMITAQEAAEMLGCSKRQVQRLATDLDGQLVGGHVWVFNRTAVLTYAEGKRNA